MKVSTHSHYLVKSLSDKEKKRDRDGDHQVAF